MNTTSQFHDPNDPLELFMNQLENALGNIGIEKTHGYMHGTINFKRQELNVHPLDRGMGGMGSLLGITIKLTGKTHSMTSTISGYDIPESLDEWAQAEGFENFDSVYKFLHMKLPTTK